MDYYTLWALGIVVGMQHALEADHLAAVAAMSAGRTSRRALVLRGGFWGLGHTVTLFLICSLLLLWDETIPPRLEAAFEVAVGGMVVLLGAKVLRKLWRQQPDRQRPADGMGRSHPHPHADDSHSHSRRSHLDEHGDLGLGRALFVGMMHGAAGSAGLLVLAAAASTVLNAFGFVLAFGAGSILGMVALSFVASYPLSVLDRGLPWLHTAAAASVGCGAVTIGVRLVTHSWGAL